MPSPHSSDLVAAVVQTLKHRFVSFGDGVVTQVARARHRIRGGGHGVFLWIPKTGGTSLFADLRKYTGARIYKTPEGARALRSPRGVLTFGHMDLREMVATGIIHESVMNRAFVFTLVRNPYTRAVSNFEYQKRRGALPVDLSFRDFSRVLVEDGVPPIGLYNIKGLSQCNPQCRWTNGINLDYVGRLEDLTRAYRRILERLGCSSPDSELRRRNRAVFRSYRTYYDEESLNAVSEFYREDFERFGYAIANRVEDVAEVMGSHQRAGATGDA